MLCSVKTLTHRNAQKKLLLKGIGLKLLTIKDKNQGQSSISKTKKHPLHQMIIFLLNFDK